MSEGIILAVDDKTYAIELATLHLEERRVPTMLALPEATADRLQHRPSGSLR